MWALRVQAARQRRLPSVRMAGGDGPQPLGFLSRPHGLTGGAPAQRGALQWATGARWAPGWH